MFPGNSERMVSCPSSRFSAECLPKLELGQINSFRTSSLAPQRQFKAFQSLRWNLSLSASGWKLSRLFMTFSSSCQAKRLQRPQLAANHMRRPRIGDAFQVPAQNRGLAEGLRLKYAVSCSRTMSTTAFCSLFRDVNLSKTRRNLKKSQNANFFAEI